MTHPRMPPSHATRADIPPPKQKPTDPIRSGTTNRWSRKWALRPRILTDVSKRDTRAVVLGERVTMPILAAPTSFHALVHPDGAGAAAGTIMVARTISTRPLEEVAAAFDAPRCFKLYVYKDRTVTEDLVQRAVK